VTKQQRKKRAPDPAPPGERASANPRGYTTPTDPDQQAHEQVRPSPVEFELAGERFESGQLSDELSGAATIKTQGTPWAGDSARVDRSAAARVTGSAASYEFEETEVVSLVADFSDSPFSQDQATEISDDPAPSTDPAASVTAQFERAPATDPEVAPRTEATQPGRREAPHAPAQQATENERPRGLPFGHFRLLRLLGEGGMGSVYKARARQERGRERTVALKRLQVAGVDRAHFVDMFLDEASIMIRLAHPNIVKLHQFGKVGAEHFIAMEYVNGRDLGSLTRELRQQRTALPVSLAVHVVRQVLQALAHAHAATDASGAPARIVHRDVSPPNILCSYAGEVKLTDFGVAKAATRQAVTKPGELRGKLAYMAPEQFTDGEIDERTDVFALGTVFFEMLRGASLFRGRAALETMQNVMEAPIPPLSRFRTDVPPQLEVVIQTALQRDPTQRFASARAMTRALAQAADEFPEEAMASSLAALLDQLFAGAEPGTEV